MLAYTVADLCPQAYRNYTHFLEKPRARGLYEVRLTSRLGEANTNGARLGLDFSSHGGLSPTGDSVPLGTQ